MEIRFRLSTHEELKFVGPHTLCNKSLHRACADLSMCIAINVFEHVCFVQWISQRFGFIYQYSLGTKISQSPLCQLQCLCRWASCVQGFTEWFLRVCFCTANFHYEIINRSYILHHYFHVHIADGPPFSWALWCPLCGKTNPSEQGRQVMSKQAGRWRG